MTFSTHVKGRHVRKVVFTVDGQKKWTAVQRPFRFHLNTYGLRNGSHVLAVKAVYAHHVAKVAHKRFLVHNFLAAATSSTTGFVSPPANGVAGPSAAGFNRETYKYSSTLTTSQESTRYQVMVMQSTNYAMVPLLHAANPGLKIMMYTHAWVSRVSDPNALAVCTSYQSDLASHPNWFLHDQYGRPILMTNTDEYVMDVGDPSYQQACAAHVAALAKQYGFDGVFLDVTDPILRWHLPAGITVPKYSTPSAWQAAMGSWLNYAGATFHSQSLKVIANIGGSTSAPGIWQAWNTPLDGAEEEAWTDGGKGLAQQASSFAAKLANEAWSTANGKIVIEHSYNTTQTGNSYGMAAMMLGAQTTASYSTSNGNYTSYETWYPDYTTAQSLGAPYGSFVKMSNGVYERAFSKGVVVVNATGSTIPSFVLGGGIYTGSGVTNAKSVAMAPYTGMVLYKVG